MVDTTAVRAAGGVVWRPDPVGGPQPQIVLVHRPRHDDWSLPKGKVHPGEHPLAAAVREVFEETSARSVPQTRLPSVRYRDGVTGREKVVEYWSMRATRWSDRRPDHEVDEVRWVGPTDAARLLTYPQDRHVVRAFVGQPPVTGIVALVRHALAGEARTWRGDDARRPLEPAGVADATAIAAVLAVIGPSRILSATVDRCLQTVAALSELVGVPVEPDARFDARSDVTTAAEGLRSLAQRDGPAVVCSQGELIPPLLGALAARPAEQFRTPKGHGWLLAFAGSGLVAAAPVTPHPQ